MSRPYARHAPNAAYAAQRARADELDAIRLQRPLTGEEIAEADRLAGHLAMSYGWAALFVAVASRVPRLLERPVVSGLLFGVMVFLAMRLVVLPLSAFPYPVSFKPQSAGPDLFSHLFFFGLPIALAAARYLRRPMRP